VVDHLANLLALRAVASGLLVATTGPAELSATATGFARTSGSFVADGFAVGMEVEPLNFASAVPGFVVGVSALILTTLQPQTPEAAAGGRTLRVGLPLMRAWENATAFVPDDGRPFVEEDYVPGPEREIVPGVMETDPLYVLRLYFPSGFGVAGPYAVADALKRRYRPRQQMALSTGYVLKVRESPAPYRGQLTQRNGRAMIPVTIPCRTLTANNT
jgi:hypothetical protein